MYLWYIIAATIGNCYKWIAIWDFHLQTTRGSTVLKKKLLLAFPTIYFVPRYKVLPGFSQV